MISRKEKNWNWQVFQHFQCPPDSVPVEAVVFKHVSGNHDERAILGDGQLPEGANGGEAGGIETRLRIGIVVGVQEPASYAELPVGRVQETNSRI